MTGMIVYAYDSHTQEAESGGLRTQGQSGLQNETLSHPPMNFF
jgi:hypothetical protein